MAMLNNQMVRICVSYGFTETFPWCFGVFPMVSGFQGQPSLRQAPHTENNKPVTRRGRDTASRGW